MTLLFTTFFLQKGYFWAPLKVPAVPSSYRKHTTIAQKKIIFVNVFIIFVLGEILKILLEHLVLCPQIKAIINIEIVEESNYFICVNMQTLVLHYTLYIFCLLFL